MAPRSAHIFPFHPVFNSPCGLTTTGPELEDPSAPAAFGTAALGNAGAAVAVVAVAAGVAVAAALALLA